jgi:hypothetical protein
MIMMMTIIIIKIIILLFCDGKRPPGQKLFMHFHPQSMLRIDGVILPVPVYRVASWQAQGQVSQCRRMFILSK